MKKICFLLFIIVFFSGSIIAQTVSVDGECINGTITLNPIPDIDGKPAYEGFGTVEGIPGIQVNIYWMPAPDDLWVLAFDGQPYFQNPCLTNLPPGTANPPCPWATVDGMVCTGGAALSVTGDVVLPVTLLDFTASKTNKNVILKWKTSGERNNMGFEIQRSNDGMNWTNIGFVNGHALSTVEISYQFTDPAPQKGKNAYRLLQVDLDGNQSYSGVVYVNFQSNTFYTLSVNPANGVYKINMPTGVEKLELNVIDAAGKVIYKKTTAAGNQLLNISGFPSGIYWLQLRIGSKLFTEKIIKSN